MYERIYLFMLKQEMPKIFDCFTSLEQYKHLMFTRNLLKSEEKRSGTKAKFS